MSLTLDIYYNLPPWAQSVAASLRGYYLSRWRYDADTTRLVEEALARDEWSETQWQRWETERLEFILNRAATQVPYYRDLWTARRRNGDNASWSYLENWPLLDKQILRERSREFLAIDCNPSKMFKDNTSGTTGKSLYIWSSKQTVKQWYALFEARCRNWYQVSRHDRWAILGGQLITPFSQTKPPFWIWNSGLNQLYMSAYHLSPSFIGYYLEALKKYKVKYLLGYSAALYSLAKYAIKYNITIGMKVAITNAEPLYDWQRKAIEQAFDCPVRETYGMAEIVGAASECDQSNLHIWRDTGVIKTLSSESSENGYGELICTGLLNADMPLINYRVGDYGKLSNKKCHCSKNLPLLEDIEGRSDDILYSVDGRPCSHLHLVMGGELPIIESQIIQDKINRVKVFYVPDEGFQSSILQVITEKIKSRLGEIEILYNEVTEVPRTTRGKFRAVVCSLSPEEKEFLKSQRGA